MQLDNAGLAQLLRDEDGKAAAPALFKLHTSDGRGGWALENGAEALKLHAAGLVPQLEQYTAEGRHRKLADFEDHLDDVSLDWLNLTLIPAQ